MTRRPRVHLIDAHVYIFRAYFALPEMTAPDGTPVQAAYGFAGTLLRYLSELRPTHVATAFDFALSSFRNEIHPGYKADRGEPPEELEAQFALCTEVATALGLPVLQARGFEADDVIASLVHRLRGRARFAVVSSDKDLTQLVTESGSVALHDFARARWYDADAVRERFGVAPRRIPDFLALVGDAVDNLPGVPGVGPKSAAALLGRYRRIERIPRDARHWPELGLRGARRLAARIAEHRKSALEVRELATLRRDVPGLPERVGALRYPGPDRGRLRPLFERLGWGGLLERALRLPGD